MTVETLTIQPPATTTVACPQPSVFVQGSPRGDLAVAAWEWLWAPRFGAVRLALRQDASAGGAPLPPVGTPVTVEHLGMTMPCVVTAHVSEFDQRGQTLLAEAVHQLAASLSATLSGTWHRGESCPFYVPGTVVRFNAADALAGAEPVLLRGRACRVFDCGEGARNWTVADALAYLLAACAPENMAAPAHEELLALAGEAELDEIDVTGLSAAEAIAKVAAAGGLAVRARREGLGLEVFRPGLDGRRRNMRLAQSGAPASTAGGTLWRARISLGPRPGRRDVLVLGQRKQYECTLSLKSGWDAAMQTDRWRDLVRSMSGNWLGRAEVFRKWVLNEHGGYSGSPWNVDAMDPAAISAADFTTRRPRRFLPCLTRAASGQRLGPVVEYRLESGTPWRIWGGPLWISLGECAVYLDGDSLPSDYLEAALARTAELRVTACLEADARLTAKAPGDGGAGERVIRARWARWRQVHASSALAGAPGTAPAVTFDDTDSARQLALRHRQLDASTMAAEFTTACIDTTCGVGDLVDRIEGREVELRTRPDASPHVLGVTHDFAAQTTTLTVKG